MEHFMIPYLKVWNGIDNQKEIFTLLTYLRPREYEKLYIHFLKPLYGLFNLMGPIWKGELLLCYTKLLQRWAQLKWKDYLELGKNPRLSRDGLEGLRRLFSKLAPNVDYMMTIRMFISHVNSISGVALEIEHDHLAVQHGVLSFFDFAPYLTLQFKVPLALIIPDSTIVYRCFLSDSGMAVSRICGVVYQYKQAFEAFEHDRELQYEMLVHSQLSSQIEEGDEGAALPAPPIMPIIPGYSRDYVILFNSFVMDICNFLWRSRAFNKSDKNARGFLMNQSTIARTKQNLEEQSHVPVGKRLRAPVSPPALKDMSAKGGLDISFEEYRLQYLDHLEQNGFEGIAQFLFGSITNLLQRKLQRMERERELEEKERQSSQSVEQVSFERKDEALSNIPPPDVDKP
ncbi:hypothetical protein BGZ58_010535 [Dissophora ornata]|nr:hypothetical protein BGZ58_010535 [Dissophora ornata]